MKKTSCYVFISTLEHLPWGGCEELWYKTALLALEEGNKVCVLAFRHEETTAPLTIACRQRSGDLFPGTALPSKGRSAARVSAKLRATHPHHQTLSQLQKAIQGSEQVIILISQAGGFDFAYGYLDTIKVWLEKNNYPYHIVVQNVADVGCTLSLEAGLKQIEIYQKARSVGFVSHRNLLSSQRILAAEIPHSYLINNPLNFTTIPDYINYPETGTIAFAVVAALRCFHKGQDVLFQVLAGEEWKQRNWKLNLYGEGPDEKYLQKLSRFYGIDDKVFFHGHVTGIDTIWKKNHIHILPSLGEGTPLALIESMLCGRAAITTDVGGNAEYAEHMVSGFIADYPTLPALSKVMELAWQQREQWEAMGKKARVKIEESYDLHPQEKLYQKLMKN